MALLNKSFDAIYRHPSPTDLKVTRLIYRRIKTGKGKQLTGTGETVNIPYLTEYHSAVDITDTRNGHDN